MTKIIKLTESELIHLINDIINESESKVIEINNPSLTNFIERNLSVKNPSSGKYFYQPTSSPKAGKKLLIRHPQFDKNKKQTDVFNLIKDKQNIPFGEGTWSINGTKIKFKK